MKDLREIQGRMRFQSFDPLKQFYLVEDVWKTLLSGSPHSYFTSWGWISTWIKNLSPECDVEFVVGYRDDNPVLAFFLGRYKKFKYGLLPTSIVALNATGNPFYDRLHIEYNSILSQGPLTSELTTFFKQYGWDELVLPGVSQEFLHQLGVTNSVSSNGFYVIIDEINHSYYVDLEKVRSNSMDFLSLLSANRRSQIRRSIKQYQKDGQIEIHEAQSIEQALIFFDELVAMHEKEWSKRGKSGAFSNGHVYQFHTDLIRNRFPFGEIQLLRINNDKVTIGCLYCFVYRGDVLFYQSGFNYSLENVYRPGLVSHYYAIMHNAINGMNAYDFLAGDSSYKSSLSTDTVPMYWARMLKTRKRFSVERSVLGMKMYIKSIPGVEKNLKRIKNRLES